MKFGYTIVYVSSVADALTFYKDAFGFEKRFLHESGQYYQSSEEPSFGVSRQVIVG
jgi:uncharacterized glyoxalase superfamily protein PhnB